MKRIVNGVTYNTDTSTAIAKQEWEELDGNDTPTETGEGILYQTRGGAFFVHYEITKYVWNESERELEQRTTNTFEPVSQEQAHKWMMTGEREVFHNPFEDPPEATAEPEPGATIYIRVPASLKKQVDDAAKNAKVSGNVWAMRCVEECLQNKRITEWPSLLMIWEIASNTRVEPDWSREKCIEALLAIADYTENLAKDLTGEDDPLSVLRGGIYIGLEHEELKRRFAPFSK